MLFQYLKILKIFFIKPKDYNILIDVKLKHQLDLYFDRLNLAVNTLIQNFIKAQVI